MSLQLLSPAFSSGGAIPPEYSKDGGNASPPLIWSDVPETTRSFALIVDDPDAPSGPFVHWLLYDIPSTAAGVEPDTSTRRAARRQQAGEERFWRSGLWRPAPSERHPSLLLSSVRTRRRAGPRSGRRSGSSRAGDEGPHSRKGRAYGNVPASRARHPGGLNTAGIRSATATAH